MGPENTIRVLLNGARNRPGRSPRPDGSDAGSKRAMPQESHWCKHCAKATWHRREWPFPRSPELALTALLPLPFVWWHDPWDCTMCDRRARRELVKDGFGE